MRIPTRPRRRWRSLCGRYARGRFPGSPRSQRPPRAAASLPCAIEATFPSWSSTSWSVSRPRLEGGSATSTRRASTCCSRTTGLETSASCKTDARRAADRRGNEAHRSCAAGEWREGFGVLWRCSEAGNSCNDALLQDPEPRDRSAAPQAVLRPAWSPASAPATKSRDRFTIVRNPHSRPWGTGIGVACLAYVCGGSPAAGVTTRPGCNWPATCSGLPHEKHGEF